MLLLSLSTFAIIIAVFLLCARIPTDVY